MNNQPPFILRFVAVLMIVSGGASIVQTVSSLVNGRIYFDLVMICIPLGRGLLEGRQSSRFWTILLSGLGLLIIGIFCIKGNVPQQSQWYYGGYGTLAVMNCAVAFFGLQMPSARTWFKNTSLALPDWSVWTAPLALAGVIVAIPWAMDDHLTKSTVHDLYPVKTRFEFRDVATGSPISLLGHTISQTLIDGKGLRIPMVRTVLSGTTKDKGLFLETNGVACAPVEFAFTSLGYKTDTFTLNKDTPREVLIELQPSESTAPKP